MTLDALKTLHAALLAARYSGTRSVSYDGKSVTYASDSEMAAALADLDRRIAALERPQSPARARVLRPYASKDL